MEADQEEATTAPGPHDNAPETNRIRAGMEPGSEVCIPSRAIGTWHSKYLFLARIVIEKLPENINRTEPFRNHNMDN